eukprot:762785-Hanusia_phi.AAC.3
MHLDTLVHDVGVEHTGVGVDWEQADLLRHAQTLSDHLLLHSSRSQIVHAPLNTKELLQALARRAYHFPVLPATELAGQAGHVKEDLIHSSQEGAALLPLVKKVLRAGLQLELCHRQVQVAPQGPAHEGLMADLDARPMAAKLNLGEEDSELDKLSLRSDRLVLLLLLGSIQHVRERLESGGEKFAPRWLVVGLKGLEQLQVCLDLHLRQRGAVELEDGEQSPIEVACLCVDHGGFSELLPGVEAVGELFVASVLDQNCLFQVLSHLARGLEERLIGPIPRLLAQGPLCGPREVVGLQAQKRVLGERVREGLGGVLLMQPDGLVVSPLPQKQSEGIRGVSMLNHHVRGLLHLACLAVQVHALALRVVLLRQPHGAYGIGVAG